MGLPGGLWDEAKGLVKDVVLAPAEIAQRALTEMFGGGDADLQQIAHQLSELGEQMEDCAQKITAALNKLTWRGPAAEAFINYAQGRVRETNKLADDLQALAQSVDRLADVY